MRQIRTPRMLLMVTVACFALVLALGIGTGFLLRLAERSDGPTAFDSSITAWLVAHRTHTLTNLGRALSTLGSQVVLLPLTAIAAAILLLRRQLVLCGLLVAAWGGAILLYSVTKQVVDRHRPPVRLWLTNVGRTPSFPSGHATQSLATLVALTFLASLWLPRARWPVAILALVLVAGIGWSRAYLGVHWTTDVVAGWLIAGAWITILWRLGSASPRADAEPGETTGVEGRSRGYTRPPRGG